MSRIIELNDSPLRAVINAQGKITQIIDEHGNDMGIPTVNFNPVTGGISYLSSSGKLIPRSKNRKQEQINLSKPALIQAPAWVGSTAYSVGDTVRLNAVAGTAGQLIRCITAGTSAATGNEPAYTISSTITDNTVTWVALNRKSSVNADGYPVPIVTVSATKPTGSFHLSPYQNPDKFLQIQNPNLQNFGIGASNNAYAFDDGGSANRYGMGAGKVGWSRQIEFVTDDPKPAFSTWNNAGQLLQVFVDDYPIEEAPTRFVAGNPSYYIVDWSGVRKLRRYRVVCNQQESIRGVNVQPSSNFYAAPVIGLKATYFGDSIGGTISDYSYPKQSTMEVFAHRLMQHLGYRTDRVCSLGGTGYLAGKDVNDGNTTAKVYNAYQAVMNNPQTDYDPDLIILQFGINDIGQVRSTVLARALATWQAARAQCPNAAIIVIGPWPGSSLVNPVANIISIDNALAETFAAWGDPNSAYLSLVQNTTGPIIAGSGKWTAPASGTLTLSGNIAAANSGTLSAAFTGTTGVYNLGFIGYVGSDSNAGQTIVTGTLTNGSTAVTGLSRSITTTSTSFSYGQGNADVFVGSDGVHPSFPCIEYIVGAIGALIDDALMQMWR